MTTTDTTPEIPLKDRILRTVLLKAMADWLNDVVEAERDDLKAELVARYKDDGVKSFDSKLPDGTKVAAISLSIPKPTTTVVDEDALIAWAKDNAPELLVDHIVPAVPAHFVEAVPERVEQVLDPKRVTELLARTKPVDATGGEVVDTATSVLVDGVTYKPGADPKSFSVRFDPDGRDEVARAYKRGDLTHLVGGTPLPAIETPEVAR